MPPKRASARAAATKVAQPVKTTKNTKASKTTRDAKPAKEKKPKEVKTKTGGVTKTKQAKKPKAQPAKSRQEKAKAVQLADSEIGQDEPSPKSKQAPEKRTSPPKTPRTPKMAAKGKLGVYVPESIDLTSDNEDYTPGPPAPAAALITLKTEVLRDGTAGQDASTRASTPLRSTQASSPVMTEGYIDENMSVKLYFGHRPVPWHYEGDSWRQWPQQGRITFHGQPFVFSANDAIDPQESGDCLFRAISLLLHGSSLHHLFVRAEHGKFWQAYHDDTVNQGMVVGDTQDRALYPTNYETLQLLDNLPGKGQRTLRERLGRSGVWQHLEVLELTALLYRVQVIVFDDSARPGIAAEHRTGCRLPGEVTVRSFGPRNRTQLLLRFTGHNGGNHFQPMFADVPRPEEYRCTLLDHISVTDSLRHFQYRRNASRKGPPSEVPLPFLWRPPPTLTVGDLGWLIRSRDAVSGHIPVTH